MSAGIAPAKGQPIVLPRDSLIYRFVARLDDVNAVGVLPEGLRMANAFEGEVVEGPLAGAQIRGLDPFLIRPDGVGVVDAPETISIGDRHILAHARGYAVPTADMEIPPLEAMLEPGFAWPDADFRFTGCVLFRAADPAFAVLNHTVGVLSGTVNMGTGRLDITARAAA